MKKKTDWIPSGLLAIIAVLVGLIFTRDTSFQSDITQFMISNKVEHMIMLDSISKLNRIANSRNKNNTQKYDVLSKKVDTLYVFTIKNGNDIKNIYGLLP